MTEPIQYAIEPGIAIERIEQLSTGNGGATAEEQQAMALTLLKYMAHADHAAVRIAADAHSTAAIMGLDMVASASWSENSIVIFQYLMNEVRKEQDRSRAVQNDGLLFEGIRMIVESFRAAQAKQAPVAVPPQAS